MTNKTMRQFLKGLFEGLYLIGMIALGQILASAFELEDWRFWIIILINFINGIYWYIEGRNNKDE